MPTAVASVFMCSVVQALNIIFLGDKSGKCTFFPEGIPGRVNTGQGFDELPSGTENFPVWPKKAPQVKIPSNRISPRPCMFSGILVQFWSTGKVF